MIQFYSFLTEWKELKIEIFHCERGQFLNSYCYVCTTLVNLMSVFPLLSSWKALQVVSIESKKASFHQLCACSHLLKRCTQISRFSVIQVLLRKNINIEAKLSLNWAKTELKLSKTELKLRWNWAVPDLSQFYPNFDTILTLILTQFWPIFASLTNILFKIIVKKTYFLLGLLASLAWLFLLFLVLSLSLLFSTLALFNLSWPLLAFLEEPPPNPLTFHLNMIQMFIFHTWKRTVLTLSNMSINNTMEKSPIFCDLANRIQSKPFYSISCEISHLAKILEWFAAFNLLKVSAQFWLSLE